MQKITPFLWFDDKAEEAARFYVSIFRNSKIVKVTRYSAAGARASGRPEGSVMTVEFKLEGQPFVALNGGPEFTFTPAVSFVASCRTQGEIDALWEKLSRGGEEMPCGWLRDRYGVTWQVVPNVIGELMGDPDPARSERVTEALVQMKKIDVDALMKAYGKKPRIVAARRRSSRAGR
ncbi:MAG TPA: VOC family protein, partial [Candidatus Deferrimicrobiaceae bacterium]